MIDIKHGFVVIPLHDYNKQTNTDRTYFYKYMKIINLVSRETGLNSDEFFEALAENKVVITIKKEKENG